MKDVSVLWVWVGAIAIYWTMALTVLRNTPTFSGGFTFFSLFALAVIIYIIIYMAKSWRGGAK